MITLQTPPIRTPLQENGATAPTAKEWYYFWNQSTDQINAIWNTLVTSGTHANRPAANTMPEGALYMESDRHVIYQNQGGNWIYVAGVMLGTLSPDQRPYNLSANDTGFQFRATDTQQTFYWSGITWIETTVVQYGTHAARPVASSLPLRALYVETDRGNVIYQNQGGNWVYVAGIMTGTLSPDQRPADLHANDVNFLFATSDSLEQYRWSGSAWVNQTPSNLLQLAFGSTNQTLTTSSADVLGAALTLTRAGLHLITACFCFSGGGAGDAGAAGIGQLVADGTTQPGSAIFAPLTIAGTGVSPSPATGFVTVFSQWSYRAPSTGSLVKLAAFKNTGTGTSQVTTRTSVSALWVSP